jgi:hypothetical protein
MGNSPSRRNSPGCKTLMMPITAIEIVQRLLVLHPEITSLTVFEPNEIPSAQERLGHSSISNSIVDEGIEIRNGIGLPFWDAALLSCYGKGESALPVMRQALFHNSPPKRKFSIPREEWGEARFAVESGKMSPGSILVLSSRVIVNEIAERHVPMLDFRCPANESNDSLASATAKLLGKSGGYVLNSGQSYHFYGKALLSDSEVVQFLGRALLLSPVVDRAWIGHQLIEGECGLRISGHPQGSSMPTLICEI